MITLKCGCKVDERGKFILGERCKNCKECNAMKELHPFGEKRFKDLH
ncbi:MAG: hypothetical protein ABIH49_00885 [archaeon]